MIILIVLLTLGEIYLVKDILKVIKYNSYILIISGYLIIILNRGLNSYIRGKITFVNIGKVATLILSKTVKRGLIFLLVGAILLIIYIILEYKKRRVINK